MRGYRKLIQLLELIEPCSLKSKTIPIGTDIGHISGHEENLSEFQKVAILLTMFLDYQAIKGELENKINSPKKLFYLERKPLFLNNSW